MANIIVQIMQYNGSGNDTLIPLTARQADNATNAETAVIGQYASNDTSKGTIEQRLTFLEGSQTSMSIVSGVSATTLDNKVIRSGSLCSFLLRLSSVSGISVQPTYTQIGTLPVNYRPSANWEGYGMMRLGNSFAPLFISINASTGAVTISSSVTGSPNNIYFSIGYSVV